MRKEGSFKDLIVPIAKEGYIFIAIFALITCVLALLWKFLLIPGVVLTLWCIYFFRDPERVTPLGDHLIVSPADGVISDIKKTTLPKELKEFSDGNSDEENWIRISVFMNVFNVHVNRMPINAKVKANHYFQGKFLNAALDKASVDNERQSLLLETEKHGEIALVQIAGLVARRIICYADKGSEWQQGERYGMIRFGSRVDVYVPSYADIKVAQGQTAIAGELVLASLHHEKEEHEGSMLKVAIRER